MTTGGDRNGSVAARSCSIASLPWYDLSEVREANDELWRRVRARLAERGVDSHPPCLDRQIPFRTQWSSPALVLSQACGYDAVKVHRADLQVVATPCYEADGCDGPTYSSFVVVAAGASYRRIEDLRGVRCAVNDLASHSGMNGLRALVAPHHRDGRFFAAVEHTGEHEESLRRVASGQVDVAAIDCVTHALMVRHRPGLMAATRILEQRTRPVPAPPFVTSRAAPAGLLRALRAALGQVVADPMSAPLRHALMLRGIELLPVAAYRPLLDQEREAIRRGYSVLA